MHMTLRMYVYTDCTFDTTHLLGQEEAMHVVLCSHQHLPRYPASYERTVKGYSDKEQSS